MYQTDMTHHIMTTPVTSFSSTGTQPNKVVCSFTDGRRDPKLLSLKHIAKVAELVDALVLGTSGQPP